MDVNPDTPPPGEGAETELLLARAGWLRVLDDIHGGLCHDLNGRVSSLDGLLHILHMDESAEAKVMSFIEGETTRLAETVKVLRSLSGLPDARVEAVQVEDLVARAAALHRRHRGLESVKTHTAVVEGTPPVRVAAPRLLRVVLLVLSHMGRAARAVKASGVNLRVAQEEGRVLFRFSPHGEDAAVDLSGLEAVVEPLAGLMALDEGDVSVTPAGVSLSLPPLTRAGA